VNVPRPCILGVALFAMTACGEADPAMMEADTATGDASGADSAVRPADAGGGDATRDADSTGPDAGPEPDAGGAADTAPVLDGGAGGGVGCAGACLFETSYTIGEGWTRDLMQHGDGCGAGFASIQAGVSNGGAWHGVACDEVTVAANFPGGAGGRGFRHYRDEGTNRNGGGMGISLPSTAREIWYSFRMRNAPGFQFEGGGNPHYTKDLYWRSGGYLVVGHQGGGFGFHVSGHDNYPGAISWNALYGGATADDSWHCLDYYHDMGSGTARVWIDGMLVLDSTSIDYSGFEDFDGFLLGSNQSFVSGGNFYTDYDDLRIDTGLVPGSRLGCRGSGG
jgi:hypothetical protein